VRGSRTSSSRRCETTFWCPALQAKDALASEITAGFGAVDKSLSERLARIPGVLGLKG
jgi:hypothetical protein